MLTKSVVIGNYEKSSKGSQIGKSLEELERQTT
jgi:hypothetical protein